MASASPQEVADLKNDVTDLQAKLKDAQEKLAKEPSSDGKTKASQMIAAKVGLAAQIMSLLTPIGWVNISPEMIRDLREQMHKNWEWLTALLSELVGLIKDIVEGLIGVFKSVGKQIVAIFESSDGQAQISRLDPGTVRLDGRTDNVQVRFSDSLQRFGLPANAGPFSGTWTATANIDGTDAAGAQRYRVVQYSAVIGDFNIGPARLKNLRQVIDVEKSSSFIVGPGGDVTGTLFTRFQSDSWPDEPHGIPAMAQVQGTIAGNVFRYHSDGEDYCWASHLVPDAVAAVTSDQPAVINTDLQLSPYSADRFVGRLVRTGVALPTAEMLNNAVERVVPPGAAVSTGDLRRVSDLALTNPFEGPVSDVLGRKTTPGG